MRRATTVQLPSAERCVTTLADLSPSPFPGTGGPSLNVDWLGREVPFETGAVDVRLVEVLVRLAVEPANLLRGVHDCELCDAGSYVAPTLAIHTITEHRYRPPAPFCDAVLQMAEVIEEGGTEHV